MTARHFIQGRAVPGISFKIDDSVPLPVAGKTTGASVRLRQTLDSMKVGQSVAVPIDPHTGRALVRLGNATRGLIGKEFTQRKCREGTPPVEVVRIWRTK